MICVKHRHRRQLNMTREEQADVELKKTKERVRRHLRRANNLAVHYRTKLSELARGTERGGAYDRPLFRFDDGS